MTLGRIVLSHIMYQSGQSVDALCRDFSGPLSPGLFMWVSSNLVYTPTIQPLQAAIPSQVTHSWNSPNTNV